MELKLQQKELEFWLASISVLGPVKTVKLLNYFGDEEEIYKTKEEALQEVEGISQQDARCIVESRKEERIRRSFSKMVDEGVRLITIHDQAYPERLRHIHKYPYGLFVKGKLPREEKKSVSIVGARNCTAYGREMAMWFARELSNAGIQVISGMAYGIDGSAHQGALQGKTPTYAVLGSGIDVCYPKEHFRLYEDIGHSGGVISEYTLGMPGKAYQFPMRNRIISGLADAVLVVEARSRSGSLITTDLALEQGKDVFVIPGRIGDPLSEGCLNLLKQGAEPVTSPEDMIHNFHLESVGEWRQLNILDMFEEHSQKKVYATLSLEPKHLEQILEETQMLLSEVISILLKLEMNGFVRETTKNCYIRTQ